MLLKSKFLQFSWTGCHRWPLCLIWLGFVVIPTFSHFVYSLIAVDERVTFCFNAHVHCLVHVRVLLYLRIGLCITITQAHTQTMQQTRTHKAVAGLVKVKMLLSCRRQSDYSVLTNRLQGTVKIEDFCFNFCLFVCFYFSQKLHLPPDLSETVSRSQADHSAIAPAVGCGSGSSSKSKLDFWVPYGLQ